MTTKDDLKREAWDYLCEKVATGKPIDYNKFCSFIDRATEAAEKRGMERAAEIAEDVKTFDDMDIQAGVLKKIIATAIRKEIRL